MAFWLTPAFIAVTVALLIFVYATGGVPSSSRSMGELVGSALTFYIVPGIIPVVWWLFMKHRTSNAVGRALVLWLILLGIMAFFAYRGSTA